MQDQRYRLEGVGRVVVHVHGRFGGYMTVDLADFARVRCRRWRLQPDGYVIACIPKDPKERTESVHRFLLGLRPGDGLQGDHKDRNRQNNRRSNLRIVTIAENNQNTFGRGDGKSKYRGVSWFSATQKWTASVSVNGKRYFLGRYSDELVAARVAAEFRRQHMPHNIEPPMP